MPIFENVFLYVRETKWFLLSTKWLNMLIEKTMISLDFFLHNVIYAIALLQILISVNILNVNIC